MLYTKTKKGLAHLNVKISQSQNYSYSLNLAVLPYDCRVGEGCHRHLSNIVERRLKRK